MFVRPKFTYPSVEKEDFFIKSAEFQKDEIRLFEFGYEEFILNISERSFIYMQTVNINGQPLEVKEYKGHRVVTFKDIDRVHGRPDGTARKRFNDNRERFIEGEDFFKVCASEIRTHKIFDISPKAHEDVTLVTESGYLMIVKSFTDDLAWSVQRQLINVYFKARALTDSYSDMMLTLLSKYNELERRIESFEDAKPLALQTTVTENSSIVSDFIDECCERCCGTRNNVTTADLYRAFEKWCLRKNTNAVSKPDFINQICVYFGTDDKRNIRKNVAGKWYYLITLTPSAVKDLI